MRMNKGKPFTGIEADVGEVPVFSEAFLYEYVGKGDGRFILGVAEEYEHIIDALGPEAVRAVLDVRPRLAQRLGAGAKLTEFLADARSDEALRRVEEMPAQVILDEEAAHAVWKVLHEEYRRHFDPEKSLGADMLRAYHTLTDGLGSWEQGQRATEQARLPEKLAQQAARKAERERQRAEESEPKESGGTPT